MLTNFYELLSKDSINIKECVSFFGENSLEVEESLFFQYCDTLYDDMDCNEIFKKRLENWEDSKSLFFEKIKTKSDLLLQSASDSIKKIVNNSLLFDEGDPSRISIDVKFPNGKIDYFYFNKYSDEPVYIINIYLTTGESLFSYLDLYEEGYLQRIGVLTDQPTFISVRAKPYQDSKEVYKLVTNQPFYYTPNSECLWWNINIPGRMNGYVFWDLIVPIGNLTEKDRQKFNSMIKGK